MWLQLLSKIFVGSVVGYTTNDMAIQMLFRKRLGLEEYDASSSPTIAFPVSGRGVPKVSLISSSPSLAEDGNLGTFMFTLTASVPTATDLRVSFSVSGTAIYNENYYYVRGADTFTATEGTLTIPEGQTSAEVVIMSQQDAIFEDNETIILTITP
ncbi:MAG: hypothetical protein AAF740_07685 [Bacteroidota bacterium]